MANPQWAEFFRADLDVVPYFSSPEWERLCNYLHAEGVLPTNCIFVEIGHDGF